MSGLTPEDMRVIAEGAKLQGFLPYLNETIDKLERTLENQVFDQLQKKTLTPEAALLAWMQKLTYRQLARSFNTKVRMGQSIGEDHKQELGAGYGEDR